jgi:hypothetical protein
MAPALFIAALGLQQDSQAANRLVELARSAALRTQPQEPAILIHNQIEWRHEEIGTLEKVPPLPSDFVEQTEPVERLAQWLKHERRAAICGLPGMGKSTSAAAPAHAYLPRHPVFWLSFGHGVNQTPEVLLRSIPCVRLSLSSTMFTLWRIKGRCWRPSMVWQPKRPTVECRS